MIHDTKNPCRAKLASRPCLAAMLLLALAVPPALAQQSPPTITDIRGRTVDIDLPVETIAIDDGRFLVALALIHPDPVGLLAGWPADVDRLGDDAHAAFLAASPGLADVATIPSSAQAFDVEAVLAVAPDVAVVSAGSGPTGEQVALLEAAGIEVVFIDFFVDPLENLEPSLRLLGALTGGSDRAEDYIAFRAAHLARIADAVAGLAEEERPTVFLEAHAGISADCCNSVGAGNVGSYIDLVGGRNIGADVLPQAAGRLDLEYVISRDPDVYIATGGPHLARAGGLVLGAAQTPETARESLERMAARTGISSLGAVADGRAHGFSHQLVNSPLDVVAVEVFAKWIHPGLFADLDPEATLAELGARFLAVPHEGTYWIDLAADGHAQGHAAAEAGDTATPAAPVPMFNACSAYVDRTAADADRTLDWDYGIENDPERCIVVRVGQTVTFEGNLNAHPIDAQGGDDPNPFDGAISSAAAFTFDRPGAFGFVCIYHDEMQGVVWVVE